MNRQVLTATGNYLHLKQHYSVPHETDIPLSAQYYTLQHYITLTTLHRTILTTQN
jgi:hypothetical protein